MADGEADSPIWDEYAHVYILGLNDYMTREPMKQFEDMKLQRIYDLGRFVK